MIIWDDDIPKPKNYLLDEPCAVLIGVRNAFGILILIGFVVWVIVRIFR
jgi:hypothetical protein